LREYYHRRAPEYDHWYLGVHDAETKQAAFLAELAELEHLPPARTLDVAFGTGFLTRHLPGEVVGLDQSDAMLDVAREQAPNADYVVGDGAVWPVFKLFFLPKQLGGGDLLYAGAWFVVVRS